MEDLPIRHISALLFLSFGGHLWRSTFPIFEMYLLQANFVTPSSYGLLLSFQSLPSLFSTFFIGYLYDVFQHGRVIVALLSIALAGQLIFVASVYYSIFELAMCGQFVFGVGICGVVATQRAMVAQYFKVRVDLIR
jgi:MFS family permease